MECLRGQDEFRHGFGEEMLHVKEGVTHLYFYYVDGALYKLQMTLPKDQQKEFLKAVVRAYGEPTITSEKVDSPPMQTKPCAFGQTLASVSRSPITVRGSSVSVSDGRTHGLMPSLKQNGLMRMLTPSIL